MRYLLKEKSPWKLVEKVDATPTEVMNELKKLIDDGLVEIRDGKIYLTDKAQDEIEKLRIKYYDVRCSECGGKGYKEDAFGVLDKYKKIVKNRPKPTAEYDQGYIAEEDVMRRVSFIYERGDLEGSDVMVIGDDDLISIAASLTNLPRRVVVLEIDDRLIDFINRTAEKYDLSVKAQKYDVRKPIPEDFVGKFDTFITDPVETIPGITLFLSRAASSLHEDGAGYFGLTHIEASLKKWAEIERMLLDMNFVITDMLRDFSVYPMRGNIELSESDYIITREMAKLIGTSRIDADFYRSTLIRVESIGKPNPKIRGHVELTREMYVDDESIVTAMATR